MEKREERRTYGLLCDFLRIPNFRNSTTWKLGSWVINPVATLRFSFGSFYAPLKREGCENLTLFSATTRNKKTESGWSLEFASLLLAVCQSSFLLLVLVVGNPVPAHLIISNRQHRSLAQAFLLASHSTRPPRTIRG